MTLTCNLAQQCNRGVFWQLYCSVERKTKSHENTILAIGALAAITILSSCGQREEDKLAIDKLTSQNNHLIHQTAERNGQISKFKSEINSIHQSLQLIKEQEQLIGAVSDTDLQTSATIQADLEKLSDLLSHNKNKINNLNSSLNSRDLKLVISIDCGHAEVSTRRSGDVTVQLG